MSKTKKLKDLLDALAACGICLAETADALKRDFLNKERGAASSEPEAESPEKQASGKAAADDSAPKSEKGSAPSSNEKKEDPPAKTFTKEEIRALLAAKAAEKDGIFRQQIRDLVHRYARGGTLKDIDPSDYAAVAAETEALTHA